MIGGIAKITKKNKKTSRIDDAVTPKKNSRMGHLQSNSSMILIPLVFVRIALSTLHSN